MKQSNTITFTQQKNAWNDLITLPTHLGKGHFDFLCDACELFFFSESFLT